MLDKNKIPLIAPELISALRSGSITGTTFLDNRIVPVINQYWVSQLHTGSELFNIMQLRVDVNNID